MLETEELTQLIGQDKRMFMTGNEAVAWAALASGADFLYGYPITPQNEIMHYWAKLAPEFGKGFLQTEDEMSAGFAMLGGAMVGKKTFSATAGPGNILMQEPISMAEMMRLPGVWVIQQRGGPSTATVIYSQQELRLTTFGGNGEGLRVVYSTGSHQDLFDYTVKAFNTAWKYRFPTFVLGDGYQAKMREPVTIYDPRLRGTEMIETEPIIGKAGMPVIDREPSYIRNTFNIEEELNETLSAHFQDYHRMEPEITEWEEDIPDGTELIVVSHGIVSRAAKSGVSELRVSGAKVGYFRPITVRPFPEKSLRDAIGRNPACKILVAESAQGQLLAMVKEALYGLTRPIFGLLKPGVGITSEDIVVHAIKTLQERIA